MQFIDVSRYVGPAPVPLAQYNAYVRACMAARPYVDRDRLATGFDHLIVNKAMFDQLGPAVNSGKSLFLYGAPGNGKTVVAEGHRPRARHRDVRARTPIDVDGQIITMFDPVNHVRSAARREPQQRRRRGGPRPAVGEDPPAGGRGRRRADARDARPDVQPDREVLRGADPAEGQRRRVRRRRLRPPAHSAARPAEPLDRAAREPRRLPDAAHRAASSRCRSTSSSCSRPTSSRSRSPTKRSCAASRTRSCAKNPTMDESLQDLRAELQEARDAVRSGDGRVPAPEVLPAPQTADARVPSRAIWSSRSSTCAAIRSETPLITRELLDAACGSYFLEETESQGAGA